MTNNISKRGNISHSTSFMKNMGRISQSVIFAVSLSITTTASHAQNSAKDTRYKNFIAEAKSALTRDFKDPSSAVFRNTYVYSSGDKLTLCGEVNAKNSYGAYVGFVPFAASKSHVSLPKGDSDEFFPLMYKLRCETKLTKDR